jgi:hypothetical protein
VAELKDERQEEWKEIGKALQEETDQRKIIELARRLKR